MRIIGIYTRFLYFNRVMLFHYLHESKKMIIWNQSIYSVTENINHVLTFLFFKNQSSFLRSTFIFFNMWIFYALIFVILVYPIIVWIGITLAVSFPIILVLSPVFSAIC